MLLACAGCRSTASHELHTAALRPEGPFLLRAAYHLWRELPPRNADGSLNVVVEIPTGTMEKWQVRHADGALEWEFEAGKPRVVAYLGYPGNYGIVPGTLQNAATGGDGDPLDVLVLGPAQPRGAVLRVRLVGLLRLTDRGARDDKLLALLEGPLQAMDLAALRHRYPGVLDIVETWFSHYKGSGHVVSGGLAERDVALGVLQEAASAFAAHR